jgi:hypothetical protein
MSREAFHAVFSCRGVKGVKAMATILEFPQPRLRVVPRGAMRRAAEIVIFPGVRIERNEFSLSARLPAERRRRRPPAFRRTSPVKSDDE